MIYKIFLSSYILIDIFFSYMLAIEATKANGDYLWHGSALEGLCVGLLLAAYLHTEVGVRNLNYHHAYYESIIQYLYDYFYNSLLSFNIQLHQLQLQLI